MDELRMKSAILMLAGAFCMAIVLRPAGGVTGKVIDADTKEALTGVTVKQQGTTNQVITGWFGQFCYHAFATGRDRSGKHDFG